MEIEIYSATGDVQKAIDVFLPGALIFSEV